MTRFFGVSVIPVICTAIIAYFAYYAISGTRGYHAYDTVTGELATREQKLAYIRSERMRLQHRVDLLESGHVDPDMLQEIARDQMLGSTPGQIAIPRKNH